MYRQDAYKNIGEFELAIADCSKVISLNPMEASAYKGRAVSHFFLGNFAETIPDATKLLELDPTDAQGY